MGGDPVADGFHGCAAGQMAEHVDGGGVHGVDRAVARGEEVFEDFAGQGGEAVGGEGGERDGRALDGYGGGVGYRELRFGFEP